MSNMTNSNVNSKRGGTVNLGSSLAAAATRQKDAIEQQPQLTGKEAFRAEIAAELDARSEETAKLDACAWNFQTVTERER
jgi:DNA-directed RNA polymerase specialized sigma subunit